MLNQPEMTKNNFTNMNTNTNTNMNNNNNTNTNSNKDLGISSLYDEITHNHHYRQLSHIKLFTRKTHSVDKTNTNDKYISPSINKQIQNKKITSILNRENITNENINFTMGNSSLINNTSFVNNKSVITDSVNVNNTQLQDKIKERLIQNLKNNFSQDRIHKRKLLKVNVNVNLNQNCSLINNTPNNSDKTSSFFEQRSNSNVNIIKKNFLKKDQPYKLYTDVSAVNMRMHNDKNECDCSFIQIKNNNEKFNTSNNYNFYQISERLYDLEFKMEKMLKENKTNSKSRKYNIVKSIFEESLKLFNNNTIYNFYMKIFANFHSVVLAYAKENKELREICEILKNKYSNIDKEYQCLSKVIKEKNEEIEKLNAKLINDSSSFNVGVFNSFDPTKITFNAMDEDNNISTNVLHKKSVSMHQLKIDGVNKENIDDLEALYFNDKIEMKDSIKNYNVPLLDLDNLENYQRNNINVPLNNMNLINLKLINKKG